MTPINKIKYRSATDSATSQKICARTADRQDARSCSETFGSSHHQQPGHQKDRDPRDPTFASPPKREDEEECEDERRSAARREDRAVRSRTWQVATKDDLHFAGVRVKALSSASKKRCVISSRSGKTGRRRQHSHTRSTPLQSNYSRGIPPEG